jgi:hypothetical protein
MAVTKIPMDWMLPTDEVLASAKAMAAEDSNVAQSVCVDRDPKYGLATRLRNFAVHFKRASWDSRNDGLGSRPFMH